MPDQPAASLPSEVPEQEEEIDTPIPVSNPNLRISFADTSLVLNFFGPRPDPAPPAPDKPPESSARRKRKTPGMPFKEESESEPEEVRDPRGNKRQASGNRFSSSKVHDPRGNKREATSNRFSSSKVDDVSALLASCAL